MDPQNDWPEKWFYFNEDWCRRNTGKWFGLKPGVTSMGIGELDFPPHPGVLKRIYSDLHNIGTGYPEDRGLDRTIQAIASFQKQIFSHELTLDELVIVPRVTFAIEAVISAILSDGGEVVVIGNPVYGRFYDIISRFSKNVSVVQFSRIADKLALDMASLEQAISSRTKVIFICNPHNPTGYCLSQKEIESIGKLAKLYDALILSDEIYGCLDLSGKFVPSFKIMKRMGVRCVALSSFGKAFAVNGFQGGYMMSDPDTINRIHSFFKRPVFATSRLTQLSMEGCVDCAKDWLTHLRPVLYNNRNYLHELLAEIDILDLILPDAGYSTWIHVRKSGDNSDVSEQISDTLNIQLGSGKYFWPKTNNHIRINFGTSKENLMGKVKSIHDYFVNQYFPKRR
ncbi:pyridoxal phosphate-dependent aminotransferase [Thalassospira povalilytica]|uniref:pyridoxal phosphate-dependent aminotransferase n=1 Tax=Thalassospira povalilytica TaxID=732237 RepID=UPI001D192A9D|nr:pyridoxal phosphate-dependent aminotransferase [Thalassospira povalilytica]MCC4242087.1 pyridoxal phosphate-dependent aminotransferase [Thalassospira povalilytica]